MSQVWTPWRRMTRLAIASHERSVANARAAATELSRCRVERDEVALFLSRHGLPPVTGSDAARPA